MRRMGSKETANKETKESKEPKGTKGTKEGNEKRVKKEEGAPTPDAVAALLEENKKKNMSQA